MIFKFVKPIYRDEVLTRLMEIGWIKPGGHWTDAGGCKIEWTETGSTKMRVIGYMMRRPTKADEKSIDAFTVFFTDILKLAPELLEKDFSVKAYLVFIGLVLDCTAEGDKSKPR